MASRSDTEGIGPRLGKTGRSWRYEGAWGDAQRMGSMDTNHKTWLVLAGAAAVVTRSIRRKTIQARGAIKYRTRAFTVTGRRIDTRLVLHAAPSSCIEGSLWPSLLISVGFGFHAKRTRLDKEQLSPPGTPPHQSSSAALAYPWNSTSVTTGWPATNNDNNNGNTFAPGRVTGRLADAPPPGEKLAPLEARDLEHDSCAQRCSRRIRVQFTRAVKRPLSARFQRCFAGDREALVVVLLVARSLGPSRLDVA